MALQRLADASHRVIFLFTMSNSAAFFVPVATLTQYAHPVFGNLSVAAIDSGLVFKALTRPIQR